MANGLSPGVAARSTAIPASANGMFSGIPVAGDIALAGLGSTAFNPAWNYLGAGGAPMTAEAAAEAAAAAKNMTWSQALKADVPHAYQRGYVPPAGQTKLPFWKMPATGGTPATRKLFETATKFLPKAAARFAGPVGAAYGVGDLAYRGTSALLDATGGTGALENLGGSIYNIFNRPKEETANLAAGTLRSPFPPTNTTPTTRRMVRALNPNPLKVDVPRPPGGGGFFAGLGGLLSGAAPAAALGLGLPLGMMWPSKISEEQGITSKQIGDNPNSPTFGQIRKEPSSYFDFGGHQNFAPGSSYVPPAGIEEYRRKNDLEEMQLRQEPGLWDRTKGFFGGLLDRGFDPNLQEVPEWNPSAQRTGGFFGDLLSKAMSTAQASVSPTLPPRYVPPPDAAAQQEDLQNRLDQFDKFNPLGVDYEAPPYDPSWNKAAKIPYIRPGLPGRHPEVAAPPATPSARVSQPIIDYPTGIHPPVIQPQAIEPVRESKPEPARESAKDKAAREAREQRSAAKKQAKADTKKAVKRAVKKSTATKSVKKVVTSKKNISDAVAAARGDVKSATIIALTSGDAQRAWAKAKGIDPSTIYGSTLRKTADGRWAGGF